MPSTLTERLGCVDATLTGMSTLSGIYSLTWLCVPYHVTVVQEFRENWGIQKPILTNRINECAQSPKLFPNHFIECFTGTASIWKWVTHVRLTLNTLRPRRNQQHFADDIFKRIFFNENVWISINILLKFDPKGPINNIPALVKIMAWRRSGDKPLSEPVMVRLPTHICVTRPQWVKIDSGRSESHCGWEVVWEFLHRQLCVQKNTCDHWYFDIII